MYRLGEYDIGEINTCVKTMLFAHEEETLIMHGHMQPSDHSFTMFTHYIPFMREINISMAGFNAKRKIS